MTSFTRNNQSGVSLMLAILVLAAITAIAFSLATIVFIEIRSAGDALRTEPTLYGSFAVTEEALFQYKRFVDPADLNVAGCTGSADVCNVNGVLLSLPGSQPIAFDDSPRVEFIPHNTTKTLAMFSLADPDKYYDQVFSTVKIEALTPTSSGVQVKFIVTDSHGDTTELPQHDVPPTLNYSVSLSGQYEMVLTNPTAQDSSVSITTTRADGGTPEGLPFVGEQVLRIKAEYKGLNRTYQVRIPVP